ncbi:hypothetical protein J6TS7_29600 [Paenibacillus dendritiformis]|uniref:JAB domain-containing protein n=1 Tax=Paenibacillus TaxID=44249 RepID=UPI001B1B2B15|nr:JAB domain-containing protein [Paenibacillus dendritiformis]GIO79350.1 hypothetical protein J6TS7_29600 [Paenibacillus dendritiformis]
MESILEVVRLKQEVRDTGIPLLNVNTPSRVVDLVNQYIGDEDREVFLILCLNVKGEVNAIHRVGVGILSAALVTPREVFKTAIMNNAFGIIVAHNHPSGWVEPSREDLELTEKLAGAGEVLGIPVIDHIIVGWAEGYYSFKENSQL